MEGRKERKREREGEKERERRREGGREGERRGLVKPPVYLVLVSCEVPSFCYFLFRRGAPADDTQVDITCNSADALRERE